jgi:phosphatidate cytidylyltransferase
VGAALGAVVLVTLYTAKPVFLAVVVLAVAGGAWELATALRAGGYRVPRPPLLAAAAGLVCAAYVDGVDGLVLAALLATSVVVGWQQLAGRAGAGNTDVGAALLALGYVPFLAGFTALLLVPADGPRRVTAFVATVVASDVGGYAVGVVAGRHPMAPRISPKKSWEGLGGSVAGCALVGGILVDVLLGGAWWQGVVFGLAVVCSATAGDLVESMLKRDLGIKDMGRLLPGHGGLMDRLDSLLPTAPVAWLVLGALIPPGH